MTTSPEAIDADFLRDLKLDPSDLATLCTTEYDEPEAERSIDKELGLAGNHKLLRKAAKRNAKDMLQVANAAKHIEAMPAPGESMHCIVNGNYAAWDIVPAALKLESAKCIEELHIATLGFNKNIAAAMDAMLTAGQLKRVRLLCSHYFQNLEPEVFDQMDELLRRRRQRIMALRTHAKIILMRLTGRRHYVIESSANLRSCRNIEQFVLTNDARLWRFHREWMEAIFGGGKVKTDHDSARAED